MWAGDGADGAGQLHLMASVKCAVQIVYRPEGSVQCVVCSVHCGL